MNTFNTKAIDKSPLLNLEKGDLNDIVNKTLILDKFTTLENIGDNNETVYVVTFENDNKFYFASGILKQFLHDNMEIATFENGSYKFIGMPNVSVIYEGKHKSKHGRLYNAWTIDII